MSDAKRNFESLRKDCINGQTKAQKELYDLFAAKMLSVCFRYARNKFDAEDVFQSGWLKIFEKIHQLRNVDLIEWWMKKIFINEALQFYKKTERIDYKEAGTALEMENESYKKVYLKFQNDEITELIQNLPNKMRMVFNLYIIEGFSHKEIAEMMNISQGTSKSQLHDARMILQNKIKRLNSSESIKLESL